MLTLICIKATDPAGTETRIYRQGSNWWCADEAGEEVGFERAGIQEDAEELAMSLEDTFTPEETLRGIQQQGNPEYTYELARQV